MGHTLWLMMIWYLICLYKVGIKYFMPQNMLFFCPHKLQLYSLTKWKTISRWRAKSFCHFTKRIGIFILTKIKKGGMILYNINTYLKLLWYYTLPNLTAWNDKCNQLLESHSSISAVKRPDCSTWRKALSTHLIYTIVSVHTIYTQTVYRVIHIHTHTHTQMNR